MPQAVMPITDPFASGRAVQESIAAGQGLRHRANEEDRRAIEEQRKSEIFNKQRDEWAREAKVMKLLKEGDEQGAYSMMTLAERGQLVNIKKGMLEEEAKRMELEFVDAGITHAFGEVSKAAGFRGRLAELDPSKHDYPQKRDAFNADIAFIAALNQNVAKGIETVLAAKDKQHSEVLARDPSTIEGMQRTIANNQATFSARETAAIPLATEARKQLAGITISTDDPYAAIDALTNWKLRNAPAFEGRLAEPLEAAYTNAVRPLLSIIETEARQAGMLRSGQEFTFAQGEKLIKKRNALFAIRAIVAGQQATNLSQLFEGQDGNEAKAEIMAELQAAGISNDDLKNLANSFSAGARVTMSEEFKKKFEDYFKNRLPVTQKWVDTAVRLHPQLQGIAGDPEAFNRAARGPRQPAGADLFKSGP